MHWPLSTGPVILCRHCNGLLCNSSNPNENSLRLSSTFSQTQYTSTSSPFMYFTDSSGVVETPQRLILLLKPLWTPFTSSPTGVINTANLFQGDSTPLSSMWENGGETGVKGRFAINVPSLRCTHPITLGHCIGQIRCLFLLPKKARARWFHPKFPHVYFAYVEWFSPFSSSRFDPHSKLYRISRLFHPASKGGHRKASVIPISLIKESIHLFPKFGPVAPAEWRSSNVLEVAPAFYVNPFSDRFVYSTVF